jgi:predicted transposase YdaD
MGDTYETDLSSVKNPHDNLFIRIFSRKEKAIAFFKKYLCASLLAIIDLDSIEIVDSKHTPELGINLYNDLVFKFSLKNKSGFVYICFEHQSTIDLDMPFRFLWYVVAMIKKHREQGYKTIPILPNVLFYTGKRPWEASTKFDDYYDDPAIGSKYLHLEEFTLIPLPADREHPDYVDKDLGYCLVAFKCGREGENAYKEFRKFIQIPVFRDYFDKLLEEERLLAGIYIGLFVSGSMAELKKIVTLVTRNEQENEKFMRTIAQRYQEEGIQTGRLEIAKNMLFKLNLGVDTVQKATDLSKEVIQNLLKDVKADRKK